MRICSEDLCWESQEDAAERAWESTQAHSRSHRSAVLEHAQSIGTDPACLHPNGRASLSHRSTRDPIYKGILVRDHNLKALFA